MLVFSIVLLLLVHRRVLHHIGGHRYLIGHPGNIIRTAVSNDAYRKIPAQQLTANEQLKHLSRLKPHPVYFRTIRRPAVRRILYKKFPIPPSYHRMNSGYRRVRRPTTAIRIAAYHHDILALIELYSFLPTILIVVY